MFSRPSVTIRQGTFTGTNFSAKFPQVIDAFLGIPYALPSTGPRRFNLPVPPPPSDSSFDASRWGSRSPSSALDDCGVHEGEDCLNLNIFRPKNSSHDSEGGKKLPVVCYFNGGSFNFGQAKARNIASFVAWSSEPIIAVSFNYRVGALGFLPTTFMKRKGLLNLGLKDQAMLLEWVRDNIEAFGGDNGNVTLMGSSAGAHSVGHHLLNTTPKPVLFHKVIMESGAPTARCLYPYNHPIHEEQFQIFLKNLGLSSLPEDEILPRLRSLSFGTIRDASESVFAKYMESIRWPFQPCIDGPGGIIPTAPITSWRNHDWNKVPILTGFNTNEGAMFVPANMSTSSAFTSFFSTLRPSLTKVDLDTLNKVYQDPNTDENSPYTETRTGLGKQFKRLEAAYAHFAYIAPVRHTAHLASKPPTVSDGSKIPPVYLYHFGVEKSITGGSNHGDHQFHVDQEKNLVDYSQSQREISEKMHAYWTSFIISGDPNAIEGVERPHWEEYKTEESPGRKIVFGLGNNEMAGGRDKGVIAAMRDDTWARRECDFWWSRIDGVENTSSEHL